MRTTFCHVKIITPELPGRPSETLEWSGPDGVDTLPGLSDVDVTTSIDSIVNHFALHFAPVRFGRADSIAERVPAYSLVFIDGGVHGDEADPTLMVGLTDPAIEAEQWTPQGPQRHITIGGRGIECVLADARVFWAPYLETHKLSAGEYDARIADEFLEEITGQLIWAKKIVGEDMDPRQAVLAILFYYLTKHSSAVMNILLPGDLKIRHLLMPSGYTPQQIDANLERFPPKPGVRYDMPADWTFIGDALGLTKLTLPTATMHPQPGPVLNMLMSVVDHEFHDFFVRYERDHDGKGAPRARLVHRIKPFLRVASVGSAVRAVLAGVERSMSRRPQMSQFYAAEPSLETVEITSGDVMASQLAHGMRDIRNVFSVQPAQGAFFENDEFKSLVPPRFAGKRSDYAYFGRYGIRPLEHVTPHFVVGRDGATDEKLILHAADTMADTLKRWYDPHPVMIEGTIQVLGRSAYRAGQRLVWHGRDENGDLDGRPTREFYVTHVQHRYGAATGAFISTLMVTRGWTIAEPATPMGVS